MNWLPLLGNVALFLANAVLGYIAWSSTRILRDRLSPIVGSVIRIFMILAVTVVLLRVVLALGVETGQSPTRLLFDLWIRPAAMFSSITLALVVLWLGTRIFHRGEEVRQALGQAQKRAESLVDRLPDLVFSLDPAGTLMTVNAAARSLLGYEPAELIGKRFSTFVMNDDDDQAEQPWLNDTRTPDNRSHVLPVVLLSREGERVATLVSVSVRRSADGQFAGMDGIARDNRPQQAYELAMREHASKMENLFSVALAMGSSLDLNELLERLLDIAQSAIGYDSANVFVQRDGTYRALAMRGYPDPDALRRVPFQEIAGSHLDEMRQTRRPLIVADTTEDPTWRMSEVGAKIRSWMGAPLFVRDELIGMINLNCWRPNRYDEDDARLLSTIAAHAASAIHNADLFSRVQSQANRLERLTGRLLALQVASVKLAQASGVKQALAIVRKLINDLIEHTHAAVFLLADKSNENAEIVLLDECDAAFVAGWQATGQQIIGQRFQLGQLPFVDKEGNAGRKPLVTSRLAELAGVVFPGPIAERLQDEALATAFAAIPMWSRDRLVGYMLLARRQDTFSDEDLELLMALANIVAVTVDNVWLLEDLRSTSSELDDVISSSMDGIIAISKPGVITLWNAAATQIFGVSAANVVGSALRETSAASKNPMILGMFRRVLAGERVAIHDLEFERVDGRRIWLGGHGAPIYDASGAIAGALVVVSDVTQERAAKRQLQQTEKLSALGQVAAGVAHELNNPLTSVIGYSQLLRNAADDEQVQRDLDRVIKQAKRAARIVQNLLTFVGDHEPRRIPTDINDVLRTALEMRAYELRAANIVVECELAPGLPITLADYHQLQQVFFNLILNAEQAMLEAHNGGRLGLRSLLIDDAVLRVEIQDDGPGIAAENLSRIFDPFFTTKVVGKGTGLGLSICYGIIEEHGGRIWAESDAEAGATFIIELPLIEVKRQVSDSVKTDGVKSDVKRDA